MTKRFKINSAATLLLFAIALLGTPIPATSKDNNITNVPSSDQLMNRMIARARTTLPFFWKSMEASTDSDSKFVLKMRFPTRSGGGEHIWLANIKRNGGTITGNISGRPRDVANLVGGQKVTIISKDITDWGFVRRGKLEGYYTLRALLPRLPKQQADHYRSILAEPR